ncbi:hypothetical protein AAZX31_09G010500 [Glycine max]|uniref:F-box domain-containing protein n=2 Tax=Glycine subgen. Soja TaxID=1462606 RepID=I1L001_SOYBN|nr:F-box protein CPR1 [Glycine max]XP_028180687.1 F-box protein CPR1-like [Glycine soja]KAG4387662.1 hypothetical protein GLYMA_09G010600v4 [Glycine max]KAG4990177.1 hypothetical protein JHK87_023634 [Glycine soja]KAG5011488.1 hypothetical protein JHK86_023749 [Glycine max]KAG5132493.1 hypothetical protein JHK82_023681 [Glycine max]KAH1040925.1 hypothetical protein GYH30_023676 [Glycine max]|eukprot:XP_003534732.1 F-box protein CPR1 [Glycine max]
MSDHLPREVVTDILSRLPAKSLLRFRSTSKSWKSLIDSQHFNSVHLSRSLSLTSNTTLILRLDSDLYQTNFPTLDPPLFLNHPLMCYSNNITLLGSCNGLLCISNVADDIAFWNPSLRQHRILPSLPLPRRRLHPDTTLFAARVYGFGFDHTSPDYKLVRISYFVDLQDRSFDSQVKLYTLRANAWKTLPSMPYALCCARTMGVFVGNSLHWVVTRKLEPDQPDLIVAFDLTHEIFTELPLPDTGGVGGGFEIDVALLGDSLCMTVNFHNSKMDVWVMREYNRGDSWCKLFTLEESRELRSFKCLRPLGYSSDGNKVLLEHDRKRLCWYDLGKKEVTLVRIQGLPNLNEAMICLGTLVTPYFLPRQICRKSPTLGCQRRRDDFLSQGFKLTL